MSLLALTNTTKELHLTGEHLVLISDDGAKHEIPLCEITRVVVCGHPHISLNVLLEFLERSCPVCFLTSRGKWLGTLGQDEKVGERLICQVKALEDDDLKIRFGKALVYAKIRNQCRALSRLAARRGKSDEFKAPLQRIAGNLRRLDTCRTIPELMGLEGIAAADYFTLFNFFLPEPFKIERRSRKPPKDRTNSLLSFCYVVTAGEIEALLRVHGLEPSLGLFHTVSGKFPALAWDLLEIFRAPYCDMLCLGLLTHHQLRRDHWQEDPESGVLHLTAEGKRIFFKAAEERKRSWFHLPGESERTSYRQQQEKQIFLLLKWLEYGTADPFFQMP